MGDTQWSDSYPTPDNHASVSEGIIKQVNAEFIKKQVKFVIQVGDLEDDGTPSNLDERAKAAQDLFDAGIGFYPLRGNHEGEDNGYVTDSANAREFQKVFPQTQGGAMGALKPTALSLTNFSTVGRVNLGDPGTPDGLSDLTGLSYSFDYLKANAHGTPISAARFILLDQFTPADATQDGLGKIRPQQPWISHQLAHKPRFRANGELISGHAFVFSHKALITYNNVDSLLGNNVVLDPTSNCGQNPVGTDHFINSLHNSGVRYYIAGHDHMHNRSLIASTENRNAITGIISASCSYKFYSPWSIPLDTYFDVRAYGFTREKEISQDLFRVGYYIFTVDGPNVTAEYYASQPQNDASYIPRAGSSLKIKSTPTLSFTKRETFGYGLVGKEFLIRQGEDYTSISDTYVANPMSVGTTAKVLATNPANGGIYNAKFNPTDWTTWLGDYSGYVDPTNVDPATVNLDNPTPAPITTASAPRALTRAVDTGWKSRTPGLASDILTLWGMADIGSANTDTYVLSMSYDPESVADCTRLHHGTFGLATKGANGTWVNAVSLNSGGQKAFVLGAYNPKFGLGTYGFDSEKNIAWAVINFQGDFAVAPGI